MGLEGVREAARRDRRARFTALLHHITPELLEASFQRLRRDAAAGVDAVTWAGYAEDLASHIPDLHRRVHTGAYRATPSRRIYIPKADGRMRPLGMLRFLEHRITDQRMLRLIRKWLKVGVIDEQGQRVPGERGTP